MGIPLNNILNLTEEQIKNSKIDIFVSTHERAEELGVQYANVYLLG